MKIDLTKSTDLLIIGFIVGALSGGLNYLILFFRFFNGAFLLFLAGIPYGIISCIYFYYIDIKNRQSGLSLTFKFWVKMIMWVFICTASYFLAVNVAINSTFNKYDFFKVFSFAFAGFIGAAILVFGFYFLIMKINIKLTLLILVIQAFIACITFYALPDNNFRYLVLYTLYQGMATALLSTAFKNKPI